MERFQEVGDAGGHQDRQPVFAGGRVDVRVPAEVREVEHLAGAGGAGPQEPQEGALVADVGQVPHVPLEVGLDVGGIEQVRIWCLGP